MRTDTMTLLRTLPTLWEHVRSDLGLAGPMSGVGGAVGSPPTTARLRFSHGLGDLASAVASFATVSSRVRAYHAQFEFGRLLFEQRFAFLVVMSTRLRSSQTRCASGEHLGVRHGEGLRRAVIGSVFPAHCRVCRSRADRARQRPFDARVQIGPSTAVIRSLPRCPWPRRSGRRGSPVPCRAGEVLGEQRLGNLTSWATARQGRLAGVGQRSVSPSVP